MHPSAWVKPKLISDCDEHDFVRFHRSHEVCQANSAPGREQISPDLKVETTGIKQDRETDKTLSVQDQITHAEQLEGCVQRAYLQNASLRGITSCMPSTRREIACLAFQWVQMIRSCHEIGYNRPAISAPGIRIDCSGLICSSQTRIEHSLCDFAFFPKKDRGWILHLDLHPTLHETATLGVLKVFHSIFWFICSSLFFSRKNSYNIYLRFDENTNGRNDAHERNDTANELRFATPTGRQMISLEWILLW